MNYLPPKIEFYRKRDFSGKLNVTFQFLRENRKPLVKFTLYLLLPVCLVQTLAMNSFIGNVFTLGQTNSFTSFGAVFFRNYGIYILCMLAGSILLSALIYSLMQTYGKREDRLVNLQWSDFKEQLITNLKRSLKLLLVTFLLFVALVLVLGIIAGILASIHPALVVIAVFVFLAGCLCLIPLSLMPPIYIFEPETGLKDAIVKAWKFGFADFWSLLGFLIVISIIASVLQTVTMMPWYIVTVVGTLFSFNSDATFTPSVLYKFSVYILGIIQSMGNYIASIITITGLAFQYFHSREKHEGVTIESNITNFSELQ
jgi:membrane protein YqaA with SNARE-associated domain